MKMRRGVLPPFPPVPFALGPAALVLCVLVMLPAAGLAGQQRNASPEERARRAAERERQIQAELVSERPIEAFDTVWIEEMTWMEVRDALAAGKTTAIITTGGIEQNGPYLATGKHNYVLYGACEGVARALGDALCAPIVKLVPEGEHRRAHRDTCAIPAPSAFVKETYQAVLDRRSRRVSAAHGFEHIVL